MKYYDWSEEKNNKLKAEREIGFEDIVVAIDEGGLRDILIRPDSGQYPNQKIFIVAVSGYAYLVPFVEDEEKVFLKTIIPSRKATRKYIIEIKE